MPHSLRVKGIVGATAAAMVAAGMAMFAQAGGQGRGRGPNLPPPIELAPGNAMNNPYRMLENWPHLGDIKPGAAIGIVPDGKGGANEWDIEGGTPGGLRRNGWSRDVLKPGEKVSVRIHPMKDGTSPARHRASDRAIE